MRVLFPEAVALVSAARQGFMREPLGLDPGETGANDAALDRASALAVACPVQPVNRQPFDGVGPGRPSSSPGTWLCIE